MTTRVRFAPSPTGYVHIGSLRTALYNFLYARQQKGIYALRIEDTDQTRLVEDALVNLLKVMDWAGISHDEGPALNEDGLTTTDTGRFGPYIQSKRLGLYQQYIKQLIIQGDAYYCFCTKERMEKVREEQKANGETPRYDGLCRDISIEEAERRIAAGEPCVVRMKLPLNRDVVFQDVVRGTVTVNTIELDDQVLMKQDGFPTYHFAVVVDDHLMQVTHVIRGEEWLPSTPKHVLLYEFFNWQAPAYIHLPNILNRDKKKLSKRQGDVAVEDFRKKGYLPEALINYIALLGWSPEDGQEIMTMEELISKFNIERVSKSGAVFDVDKLNWVNSHYLKTADLARLVALSKPHLIEAGIVTEETWDSKQEWLMKLMSPLRERVSHLAELKEHLGLFMDDTVTLETDEVLEVLKEAHVPALLEAFKAHVMAAESITPEFGKGIFKILQAETGAKGKGLFMCLRCGISGQQHGMDLGELMEILGKERLIKRIEYTLAHYM